MIISDEQARAAAAYLKSTGLKPCIGHACVVPDEVIRMAVRAAEEAPDLREDRVAEARERLGSGSVDSSEVAEKMLSRIVSDALR